MRVFVAGATGAIGKRLVPALVHAGHDVTGTTRDRDKADAIARHGAHPVILDALDRRAVLDAVVQARPEVIIHQLTAIPLNASFRTFDRDFALTNRLRTAGTDHLIAAAREAGTRRFIVQSYAAWPYIREGGPVKTEDDPLDPHPPKAFRESLAAIRYVEQVALSTPGIEGIALRYGAFYGPGTGFTTGGPLIALIRKRQFPIVGGGTGVWSFVHIDDAAGGTGRAVEGGPAGVYNIVDDEPAPVAEWLPALAEAVGAKPPRRVPAWLGRLLIGEGGLSMMTRIRGASNAKAKRLLDWTPTWRTWRDGFRRGLDG